LGVFDHSEDLGRWSIAARRNGAADKVPDKLLVAADEVIE